LPKPSSAGRARRWSDDLADRSGASAREHNELIGRASQGEQINNYETERRRRDGTVFPYLISMAPHRDAEGNTIGVIGIGSDLSASRLAEEELLRSRELYRVVVENSHDMIAVLDPMDALSLRPPPMSRRSATGPKSWSTSHRSASFIPLTFSVRAMRSGRR